MAHLLNPSQNIEMPPSDLLLLWGIGLGYQSVHGSLVSSWCPCWGDHKDVPPAHPESKMYFIPFCPPVIMHISPCISFASKCQKIGYLFAPSIPQWILSLHYWHLIGNRSTKPASPPNLDSTIVKQASIMRELNDDSFVCMDFCTDSNDWFK